MEPHHADRGKTIASIDDSMLIFEAMIQDNNDILPQLMSVQDSSAFLKTIQQLPKPESEDRLQYHRVRIEGVVAAFSGFTALVKEALSPERGNWEAMIWGTSVLILRFSCSTSSGLERSLVWLEKLSNMIPLPRLNTYTSLDREERQLVAGVLQLFTDLVCSLLSLVIQLRSRPYLFSDECTQQDDSMALELEKANNTCDGASARLQRQSEWLSRLITPNALANSSSSKLRAKLPHREIPFTRNKHFYSRGDYLQQIYDYLTTSKDSPTAVSLHGLPGVGKTQLAVEYFYRFGTEYQAIIWITADNHVKLSDALANAATNLELGGCNAITDSTIATKAIRSWLKQTDEPWLLIFDNVDDIKLLQEFWPMHCKGNVIITSRDPFMALESQVAHSVRVEPLNKVESYELFCKITNHDTGTKCPRQLDQFLDDWGGMPIALTQIGGFVRENDLTWKDFIEIYTENAPLLHAHKIDTWQYEHSIATAFSIDRLDAQSKGILWALTFFDPDHIPNELLMLAFDGGASFITMKNKFEYITALGKLQKAALLRKDRKDLTVHRLVQAVVFDSMDQHDKKQSFHAVLELFARNFPRETNGRPMWQNWAQCDRYLPHVLFLWRRFQAEFPREQKCAALAELLGACTWFLFERGHFGQVAEMVETLQMVCLENQKALLATAIFIRAGLCADNNRVKEADLLIKRCVELREQILAPNDPDLGNTYYSAGIISMECDRHEESLDYHNKAMAVRKTCGDEDHTQTAVALQNLALLHVKTRNLDAAETCLDEAVQLCKASSGPESDRYAEVLFDVGNLRFAQARNSEALRVHQKSLEIRTKIIPGHFKTGFSHHKIAVLLHALARPLEAKQHIESAIQIFERTWDAVPRIARSTFLLGEVLTQLGDHERAVEASKEATKLRGSITTFPITKDETMKAYDVLVNSWFR